MKIKAVKGTNDILPNEVRKWHFIEEKAKDLFHLFGFKEIRTPIFEHSPLFIRSVGEETDIVSKEMYTFEDKGEKSLTLRPEATASVVRAYLEHHFSVQDPFQKFYYIGPMFRRERPQAGRRRQFHQIGVEVLGANSPAADAEVLSLLYSFFKQMGLGEVKILLNSVGCLNCRKDFIKELKKYFSSNTTDLCQDCQNRYEKNILRILDCKQKECQPLINKAPQVLNCLCDDCKSHFEQVKSLLDSVAIPYEVQPRLVRGLDYYTRTVFEVTHPALGAQDALGAGGRYDDLIGNFGGPKQLGAIGFALGMERLLMALENSKQEIEEKIIPKAVLISLGKEALEKNFILLSQLRAKGIYAEMEMEGKSIKSQMRLANKTQAPFVLIRGDEEIKSKIVVFKNMQTSEEKKISEEKVLETLQSN